MNDKWFNTKKSMWISSESHRQLKDIGKKGETFDMIIGRLIKCYKSYGHLEEVNPV